MFDWGYNQWWTNRMVNKQWKCVIHICMCWINYITNPLNYNRKYEKKSYTNCGCKSKGKRFQCMCNVLFFICKKIRNSNKRIKRFKILDFKHLDVNCQILCVCVCVCGMSHLVSRFYFTCCLVIIPAALRDIA